MADVSPIAGLMGRGDGSNASYFDRVRSEGAFAHYRLADLGGTVLTDALGTRHGTLSNAPSLGIPGLVWNNPYATQFDGNTSQSASVPDDVALRLSAGGTVIFWVRFVSTLGQDILSKLAAGDNPGWRFFVLGGLVYVNIQTGPQGGPNLVYGAGSTQDVTDGAIYMVAGTWDGDRLKMIVNGTLQGDSAAPAAFPEDSSNAAMKINAGPAGPAGVITVDEVSLFDRVLVIPTLADIYRYGRPR